MEYSVHILFYTIYLKRYANVVVPLTVKLALIGGTTAF
jgi:hypothetical protein